MFTNFWWASDDKNVIIPRWIMIAAAFTVLGWVLFWRHDYCRDFGNPVDEGLAVLWPVICSALVIVFARQSFHDFNRDSHEWNSASNRYEVTAARDTPPWKRICSSLNTWLGVVFVIIAFFQWKDLVGIHTPDLPATADAQQITAAYKSRVAHIQTGFVTTKNFVLWQEAVPGGVGGSGILLANDRLYGVLLTNRHVVDPTYTTGSASNISKLAVRVKLASDNDWHPAAIAAIHRSLDLAIIVIKKPFGNRGAVRVAAQQNLQQGESVVALGNPLNVDFVTTEGILSKVDAGYILTSAPISPGNSGGPLILKRRGLVAGINTAFSQRGQNMNIAIPAEFGARSGLQPPGGGTARSDSQELHRLLGNPTASTDACWEWYDNYFLYQQDVHFHMSAKEVRELLDVVPVEK